MTKRNSEDKILYLHFIQPLQIAAVVLLRLNLLVVTRNLVKYWKCLRSLHENILLNCALQRCALPEFGAAWQRIVLQSIYVYIIHGLTKLY